jgi:purine-cytosine permease-like protein
MLGESWGNSLSELTGTLSKLFDVGMIGFVVNTAVFIVVSKFTKAPESQHVATFKRDSEPPRFY